MHFYAPFLILETLNQNKVATLNKDDFSESTKDDAWLDNPRLETVKEDLVDVTVIRVFLDVIGKALVDKSNN